MQEEGVSWDGGDREEDPDEEMTRVSTEISRGSPKHGMTRDVLYGCAFPRAGSVLEAFVDFTHTDDHPRRLPRRLHHGHRRPHRARQLRVSSNSNVSAYSASAVVDNTGADAPSSRPTSAQPPRSTRSSISMPSTKPSRKRLTVNSTQSSTYRPPVAPLRAAI
jgi:hypothetical protein